MTQVWREGDWACYRQHHPSETVDHFELIRIRSHDGYTIAGNTCPPSEYYPKAEALGRDGFTLYSPEECRKKLDALRLKSSLEKP